MAGGDFAAAVMCLHCLARADRVGEGQETDWYVCSACGQKFGVDWSEDGPPRSPAWPPMPAQLAEARRLRPWLADAPPGAPPASDRPG